MTPTVILQTGTLIVGFFGVAILILLALVWDIGSQVEQQTEQLERIESHLSEMSSDDGEDER